MLPISNLIFRRNVENKIRMNSKNFEDKFNQIRVRTIKMKILAKFPLLSVPMPYVQNILAPTARLQQSSSK